DILETVNDRPVQSTAEVQAVTFGGEAVRLSFRRPDQPDPVSLTLQPAPFQNGAAGPIPQPQARRLEGEIGYVRPPAFNCGGATCNQLATALQQAIRRVDEAPTCGWVVDLRRGYSFSYVLGAGLGPLLGEGDLSRYVFP